MERDEIISVLKANSNLDKQEWARRIINTKMDMLVVKTQVLKDIAKKIIKENCFEYLDNEKFEYYENTIIYAKVLSSIKDYKTFEKYLYKYLPIIDCWASCDSIEFKFRNKDYSSFFELSKKLIQDDRTFARRIGVLIWFKLLDDVNYTLKAFEVIKDLYDEQEYYVNMCIAWFLCDAFIKQRNLTLNFIQENYLNNFVLNKTISKCQDSFRISDFDKKLLKTLKNK